jgi:hypothetical protein
MAGGDTTEGVAGFRVLIAKGLLQIRCRRRTPRRYHVEARVDGCNSIRL